MPIIFSVVSWRNCCPLNRHTNNTLNNMQTKFNTLKIIILTSITILYGCNNDNDLSPEKQLLADIDIIEQYIADNGLTAVVDPSGLRIIFNETFGDTKPNPGQLVTVDYVGFLLNGTVFDTSIEQVAIDNGIFSNSRVYQPFEFKVGAGQVIQGWDIGIPLMGIGDKATLLIPSGLAYGPFGSGSLIGPNTVIAFDVELVNIK